MKCLLTSKCWCCPKWERAPFTAWRVMVSRKHKRQLHQAVVQKKKKSFPWCFLEEVGCVILDNSTNGSICLRSTRPRIWAWAVTSGEGDRIKMGQNEEGTGKSGGFKGKSCGLERGRESMWGRNEEQRRLKEHGGGRKSVQQRERRGKEQQGLCEPETPSCGLMGY